MGTCCARRAPPSSKFVPAKGGGRESIKCSVSFGGCGMCFPYYVGVLEYLIDTFDLSDVQFIATSGAAFPVVCWAANGERPRAWMERDFPKCIQYWRSRRLGVFFDSQAFLRSVWTSFLKEDAFERASRSGNLVLTATKLRATPPFLELRLKSDFSSNAALIDAILGTCHVPGLFGFSRTKVSGETVFDGEPAQRMRCERGVHVLDANTVRVTACPALGGGGASHVGPARGFSWLSMIRPRSMKANSELARSGYVDCAARRWVFLARGWPLRETPSALAEHFP